MELMKVSCDIQPPLALPLNPLLHPSSAAQPQTTPHHTTVHIYIKMIHDSQKLGELERKTQTSTNKLD